MCLSSLLKSHVLLSERRMRTGVVRGLVADPIRCNDEDAFMALVDGAAG